MNEYGEDGCYISFSGGKDSTVLVDIADKMGYDIPLVFVDTGLEYPEIRDFVKGYGDRVEWLKPKMNFKKVIEKYGYPFISKEVSECVYGARKYLTSLQKEETLDRQTDRQPTSIGLKDSADWESMATQSPYAFQWEKLTATGRYGNVSLQMLMGVYTKNGKLTEKTIPSAKDKSRYSCERYKFFLDAPFEISNQCCNVMKKSPAHRYNKETGRYPMTAQMAAESRLRTQNWVKHGCNGFDLKIPTSNPMSFWTEQDVLLYIKTQGIPICSVYGDIIEEGQLEGQMTWDDAPGYGIFDMPNTALTTTGCKRTGCMFCGFGCHISGDDRFVRMKQTHPQVYDYIMRPKDKGGLGYKEVIDWINEHGNFNIKY